LFPGNTHARFPNISPSVPGGWHQGTCSRQGAGEFSTGHPFMLKFTFSLPTLAVLAAACALASVAVSAAISPAGTTAISSTVSTGVSGASASGPAAIVDAIKTAAEVEMKQFGVAEGKDVAAQIISDALIDGATPLEVGQALAEAALELGAPLSTDIAGAIGGLGDSETLVAFDATVAGSAGGAELAAEADAAAGTTQPAGTLGTGGAEVGGGVSGTGTGPSGSGCINPSCT
jgi:hypothetical protein